MATGFEVAGVVLATFPILVKVLGAYADGVRTITIWRRYRWELRSYARRLKSQRVRYINTLELLFDGIVESEEDLAILINDPAGVSWQGSRHMKALRSRLDWAYDHFLDILNTMMDTLEELAAKLDMDEGGNVSCSSEGHAFGLCLQIDWEKKSSVEREMKKIGLIFSKGTFTEMLDNIDSCNRELQELTRQNEELGPVRQRRRMKCPHERLMQTRKYAKSLFNVLVTGTLWACSCRDDHMVNLQLQPRPSRPHVAHENREQSPIFRILLSRSIESSPIQKVKISMPRWDRKELEVRVSEVDTSYNSTDRSETPNCRLANNESTRDSSMKRQLDSTRKRIKFLDIDERPKDIGPGPPISDSSMQYGSKITDICATLCKDQWPGQTIGHVADDQSIKHYLILFQGNKVEDNAKEYQLTLTNLLSSAPQSEKPFNLSRRERLSIASTLASSVLQLDMTLWLERFWTSDHIIFHCPFDCTSLGSDVCPYVSGKVRSNKGKSKEEDNIQSVQSSNETLLALGVTLIELCFGKLVSEMRKPEDVGTNETATKIRSAKRLLSQVYDEAGCRYGDAVKRCLESHQDFPDASFEDRKFQEAVYTTIVMPLAQDLDDFEGKYLSGKA